MKHKLITPDIREIKTGTPAIKIGDKYFVGGIGGNFIPGGLKEEQVTLGMLDENLNFQKLSFSGTEPSNDGEAIPVSNYNIWKGTLPLPESGGEGAADVILGQVDADGNFQPLTFNGTEASDSGSPEAVENYYGWNGVLPVPDNGSKVGEATEYYKCASVDTANKTWTGYKAVLTDGIYSFEENATEGLTYGAAFTPVISKVYDQTATVKVDYLYTGLPCDYVFYSSLATNIDNNGNTITQNGGSFTTIDGVQCYSASDSNLITSDVALSPENGMSYSVWIYPRSVSGWQDYITLNSTADSFNLWAQNGNIGMWYKSSSLWSPVAITEINRWYHCCLVYDSGSVIFSLDGVLYRTTSPMSFGEFTSCVIGSHEDPIDAAFSSLRIYNRPLTEGEILALSGEPIK